MSAMSHDEDARSGATRLARWAAQHESGPSAGSWLFGGPSQQASELADLHRRLAEAERRADDAEAALPHLLALGQRTVNGLLSDARIRGRQIIEEARRAAMVEIELERQAVAREADELDALRMAVAAEAMGLEQLRRQLDSGVAARRLGPGAAPVAGAGGAGIVDPRAALLPPPPSPAELDAVGMGTAAPVAKDSPSGRFAEAWAAGEDEMMVEAFDRFFQVEIERDPQRDAAVEPDSTGS